MHDIPLVMNIYREEVEFAAADHEKPDCACLQLPLYLK